MSTATHDLKVLISSYHSLIALECAEEERVSATLKSVAHALNLELMEWSSTDGLRCRELLTNASASTDPVSTLDYLREIRQEALVWLKDFGKELDNKLVVRALRDVVKAFGRSRSTLIISGPSVNLPEDVKHLAIKYDLKFPSREEYARAIENIYESLASKAKMNLSREDREKFIDLLRGMTLQQARQITAQALLSDQVFDARDLKLVEEKKVQVIKDDGLLEYYPVADNAFELGGFVGLKSWLKKMEAGFSSEARAMNLPLPKGVLFVGVPGCGKSLAAKYVARLWRLPLLKLDAGRLYSKYIGESEKNFRRAIQLSESISPSILWIDEIEKAMGGDGDMDGGVSQRLFGSFLTWLQEKSAPVFVVATANDLMKLPPELLRKGRFDEVFFVDLPSVSERGEIFRIHFKLRGLSIEDAKLSELVSLTDGFSGAEIEQVVVGSALAAIQSKSKMSVQLLKSEIQNTIPLSRSRADDIARVRTRGQEFRRVN